MEQETPADLVGIREAAPLLGVSAATVSRQVKAGIITNWGTSVAPKVSVAGAKRERAAHLDPAQQRERPRPAASVAPASSFVSAKTQHEETKAELAKLELAEKMGLVVAKAEAVDLFVTFGGLIRERLAQRWHVLSSELAGRGASEIEQLGVHADEQLLREIGEEIAREFAIVADAA